MTILLLFYRGEALVIMWDMSAPPYSYPGIEFVAECKADLVAPKLAPNYYEAREDYSDALSNKTSS